MKQDVELALQEAQNNGQKVQNFNADDLKLQTGIQIFNVCIVLVAQLFAFPYAHVQQR